MAVCLLLSAHRVVILARAQLSCYAIEPISGYVTHSVMPKDIGDIGLLTGLSALPLVFGWYSFHILLWQEAELASVDGYVPRERTANGHTS